MPWKVDVPVVCQELRQSLAVLGVGPGQGISAQQLSWAVLAWGQFRSTGRVR